MPDSGKEAQWIQNWNARSLSGLQIPTMSVSSVPEDVNRSNGSSERSDAEKASTSKVRISSTDTPSVRNFFKRSEASTSYVDRNFYHPEVATESSNGSFTENESNDDVDSKENHELQDQSNDEVSSEKSHISRSNITFQEAVPNFWNSKPRSKMTQLEISFSNLFDRPDPKTQKFFKDLKTPELPKKQIVSLRLVKKPSKKQNPRSPSPDHSSNAQSTGFKKAETEGTEQSSYPPNHTYPYFRSGFPTFDRYGSNGMRSNAEKFKKQPYLLDWRRETTYFTRPVSKPPGCKTSETKDTIGLVKVDLDSEYVEKTAYYSSNLHFQKFSLGHKKKLSDSVIPVSNEKPSSRKLSLELEESSSMEILGKGKSLKDPKTRRAESCGKLTLS